MELQSSLSASGVRAGHTRFKLRYTSHLGVRSTDAPLFAATLGTTDPIVHIEYAASKGFAGVEDNWLGTRPVAEQARIGDALARTGLEMGCFNVALQQDDPIWGRSDEASVAAVDRSVALALECARRTGGRHLSLSALRDLRAPSALQRTNLVRHLRRLAPSLEHTNVILCLEQTSPIRAPARVLERILDANEVAVSVGSPSVKLVFDFFHVQTVDGDILNNLDRVWDEIAVMQIADVPTRGELGSGELNWVAILRHVLGKAYQGLLEYEIFPTQQGAEGESIAFEALKDIDAAL